MTVVLPPRPSWYVQQGTMFENPHGVPHDEIWRMIEEETAETVAQTVFGKYVENAGLTFTGELVSNLFYGEEVKGNTWCDVAAWLSGAAEQLRSHNPFRYATGVDLARKKDYTVIFTIDTQPDPAQVVYFRRLNRVPWDTIYAEIAKPALHLFPGQLLIDSSASAGDIIQEALESRVYCSQHNLCFTADARCPFGNCSQHWVPYGVVDGYPFTGTSKVALVNHLQNVLGQGYDQNDPLKPFGRLRCPNIVHLADELALYSFDDKKLMTDCVFALALACWAGLEDLPFPIGTKTIHGG